MWFRRLCLLVVVVALIAWSPLPEPAGAAQGRYFPQTGFTITNEQFLNYFDRRGGVDTFGYPVSREFILHGYPVQIFQRAVMQRLENGQVTLMNLLDLGMMPYTQINGATFPAVDEALVASAPQVGTEGYHEAVLGWIRGVAPDTWNGHPVGFFRTFSTTVAPEDAFPGGGGDANLLSGFNLEIWGLPTSHPTPDPNNSRFVYQRFQRGIMHFDQETGVTQGVLLADYFKSILLGRGLPADLAAAAQSSPYFGQYNRLMANWVSRPEQIVNTDLTGAFEPSHPIVVVDPGHGGDDTGAIHVFPDGTRLLEKDVTLTVAKRVAEILRQHDYLVVMTRTMNTSQSLAMRDLTGDAMTSLADDLQARVDLANHVGASLFLSIHFNGHGNPEMRGTSMYYNSVRPFAQQNRYFAELLQREAVASLRNAGYDTVDLGVFEDSRAVGAGHHFYVLGPNAARPIEAPGALTEGLFVTNRQDAQQLQNPQILEALAQAHARAVLRYFGDAR